MKKLLNMSLVILLMSFIVLTACSKDKKDGASDSTPPATETPVTGTDNTPPADDQSEGAPEVTLSASKFVGVDESIDIKIASINIDGNGDDWVGMDSYSITKNTDGNDLQYPSKVSIAWDGNSTLFLKGTLTAPGALTAAQAKDSSDWWSDDIIEAFLVPSLPIDEATNRVDAIHYAASSQTMFESEDLASNGSAANIGVKDGEWVVEMAIPLEGELLDALRDHGSIYAKVGIELNSGGEYSLLGRSGGFWDVDNYIKFDFSADKAASLDPEKFAGVNASLDVAKSAITVDGTAGDWEGIESNDITKNTDGDELKFPAKASLAWDGIDTLFLKGTLTAPGGLLADQAQNSADWWADDILEVFLVSGIPADADTNRVVAIHYAANSKHVFEAEDLEDGASAANISLKNGEWIVEMSMKLSDDLLEAANKGALYAKVGIELNSGGEYSLLGRTGGFWDVDNYINLNLQ